MLMGDTVDNIPGIKGIGPKKAEKLLDKTKREDWDKLVEEKYEEFFGEGWFHRMLQNTQLLWMIQKDVLMPMKVEGYNETEEK
jgi:5'-3' exonuclease